MLADSYKLTLTRIYDPLEQFEYGCRSLCGFTQKGVFFTAFCLITITIMLGLVGYIFFNRTDPQGTAAKAGYFLIQKKIFKFFIKLCFENLNVKCSIYFPGIFFLFLFLTFSNLLGLVPYCFTVTGSIVIPFFLSVQFFSGTLIIAVVQHGHNVFKLFLPPGVPLVVAPFLCIIEIISYFARLFSLGIRLFANMMSGHSLLKILVGFVWVFIHSGGAGFFYFIFPALIVFLVTILECAIAVLQAYVFSILIIIYLNDVLSLH